MTVSIRPRGNRWQYTIAFEWPDGERFYERRNTKATSESAARRWAEQRETSLIMAGKAKAATPVATAPAAPTLAAFWPRVLTDHYHANRKKPSTIDAAVTVYDVHLGPLLGTVRVDAIGPAQVAKVKGERADRKPKTVNNILGVLSRILKCAFDWGVIASAPKKLGMLPIEDSEPHWYEVHDYRRLVDAARAVGTAEHVMVLLGGSAGLRLGEIVALKWSDLDLARGLCKVQRSVWQGQEGTPKGGRSRVVNMTGELVAACKAHRHMRGERVLVRENGTDLSVEVMRRWLASVQRRAVLPVDRLIHALRHTFCSHLAAAGVPAKAIQELAGHTDLKTTLKYMHLSPANRTDAVDTLARYYGGACAPQARKVSARIE